MGYTLGGELDLEKVVALIDYWRKRDVLRGLETTKRDQELKIYFDFENRNFEKIKERFDYFSGVYIAVVDNENRLKFFYTFSYSCMEQLSREDAFKIFEKYGVLKGE